MRIDSLALTVGIALLGLAGSAIPTDRRQTALLADLARSAPPARSVKIGMLERLQEKYVKLRLGADFRVILDSNPETKYGWTMEPMEMGPKNLTEVGNTFQPADAPLPPQLAWVKGAGGTQVFDFKAVAAGNTTLTFYYARGKETPWSKAVVRVETVEKK